LIELHNIHISYESLRQILIKEGGHEPKRKRRIHRRKWRIPKAGLLVGRYILISSISTD